jgi:1,4-alpha-glucan branching enzyme
MAPSVFIAFLQNHDQVGNRAFGDRISAVATREAVRAAAATYLLLPQTPMLFMGEEWGASSPFPFFCDFGPELADAVRRGRREEFARFPAFQDPVRRELIPDPQAASTFKSGKLDWGEAEAGDHLEWLQWYRAVLAVRKQEITQMSAEIRHAGTYEVVAPGAVVVRWEAGGSRRLVLAINLSASIVSAFPAAEGRLIWQEGRAGADGTFGAWSLRYWCTGAQS